MTLAQSRSLLVAHLETDLDNFEGDSPTEEQLTAQINYAIRTIGRALFIVRTNIALTTVIGTFRYELASLNPRVVRAIRIHRGAVPFVDYMGRPGMMNYAEMSADCPGFESGAVSGTPTRAVQLGNQIVFDKNPTAIEGLKVTGQIIPNDMVDITDDNNELPLPVWTHEAVAIVAAAYAANPSVTEEEGLNRLQRYNATGAMQIQEEGTRNRDMYGIKPMDKVGQKEETEL